MRQFQWIATEKGMVMTLLFSFKNKSPWLAGLKPIEDDVVSHVTSLHISGKNYIKDKVKKRFLAFEMGLKSSKIYVRWPRDWNVFV